MWSTFEKDRRRGKDRRSGRERRQSTDTRFERHLNERKGTRGWRIIDLRSGKDRRLGLDRRKSALGKAN